MAGQAAGRGTGKARTLFGRPSGLRRGAAPARRIWAPRRPPRLSARATALGLLLLGLILAYAYPVRTYLAQQAEIERMEADQRAQVERINDLSERLERWNDPEYVIAQARSRLQWVRPGELMYVVVEEAPEGTGEPGARPDAPWFSRLWDNVQAADNVRGADDDQLVDNGQSVGDGHAADTAGANR